MKNSPNNDIEKLSSISSNFENSLNKINFNNEKLEEIMSYIKKIDLINSTDGSLNIMLKKIKKFNKLEENYKDKIFENIEFVQNFLENDLSKLPINNISIKDDTKDLDQKPNSVNEIENTNTQNNKEELTEEKNIEIESNITKETETTTNNLKIEQDVQEKLKENKNLEKEESNLTNINKEPEKNVETNLSIANINENTESSLNIDNSSQNNIENLDYKNNLIPEKLEIKPIKEKLDEISIEEKISKNINTIENIIGKEIPFSKPELDKAKIQNIEVATENLDNTKEKYTDNNTLLISEIKGKVYLPYKIADLEKKVGRKAKEEEIEKLIQEEYIIPIKKYKNPVTSRFREGFELMRHKEKSSPLQAISLGLELSTNSLLNPAIITACKNLDELDIYLDYLDNDQPEKFEIFDIKYEILPV